MSLLLLLLETISFQLPLFVWFVCLQNTWVFLKPSVIQGQTLLSAGRDQAFYYVTLGMKSLHSFSQWHTKSHTILSHCSMCKGLWEFMRKPTELWLGTGGDERLHWGGSVLMNVCHFPVDCEVLKTMDRFPFVNWFLSCWRIWFQGVLLCASVLLFFRNKYVRIRILPESPKVQIYCFSHPSLTGYLLAHIIFKTVLNWHVFRQSFSQIPTTLPESPACPAVLHWCDSLIDINYSVPFEFADHVWSTRVESFLDRGKKHHILGKELN